ncbi:MAG: hypothetical protein NTZ90_05490 [Proteobacteria bacterium]|nr:hypothetical protein [Pseudomonadota bacterium]
MSKWSLALISCIVIGCKTTQATVESIPTSPTVSTAPACEETCAGTFASAKILGCVAACDQWVGKSIAIKTGTSLYLGLPEAKRCSFTYEMRDADQIHKGSLQQMFSFGFRYTDGIGDGDFLITGSGLTDARTLVDFAKASDQKTFGHDASASSTTLTFTREGPGQDHAPFFKIEEVDVADQETKTLSLTLSKSFDPRRPFAGLQAAAFKSVVHGKTKHDIICTP